MDYLDIDLSLTDEDLAVQQAAHKFAEQVMRPASKKLEQLTPEQQIADDSPLWDFLKKAYELGYHKVGFPEQLEGMGLTPLQQAIVQEEFGWGSTGLAIQLGAAASHALGGMLSMNPALLEEFTIPFCNCKDGSIRGCWAVTEPDHGSDTLGFGEPFFGSPEVCPNLRARRDGKEWVITGTKSAWISGAAVATHVLVHVQIDSTKGFAGMGAAVLPLNLPGVSRGKPHEMLGNRELNQCELYFDDVRIPKHYMFLDNADYYFPYGKQILAGFNMMVACNATGLARAAFEEAFSYCHERVQGGRLLKEHYSVKQKVFEMFSRVETARAISRRAFQLNGSIFPGFCEYSIAAKTTATEMAFQNAHDAISIFGASGLSKEYLPEKLFRDARENLIADGTTETLRKVGGHFMFETYPRPRSSIQRMGWKRAGHGMASIAITTQKRREKMAYTTVKETFEKFPSVFQAAKAKGMNSVIQYVFDGEGGGKWFIEIKDGSCRTGEGTLDSPNVTITMSVETWLALVNEEISGMQAFMGGKLKVVGDTGLAQKVSILFPL